MSHYSSFIKSTTFSLSFLFYFIKIRTKIIAFLMEIHNNESSWVTTLIISLFSLWHYKNMILIIILLEIIYDVVSQKLKFVRF